MELSSEDQLLHHATTKVEVNHAMLATISPCPNGPLLLLQKHMFGHL